MDVFIKLVKFMMALYGAWTSAVTAWRLGAELFA
jgi:hypothetical protein